MKYILSYEDENFKEKNFEKFINIPESLNSKENLFKFFKNELNFPEYFGHNWDAFYDLLSDLYWLNVKEVVIYHNSLPQLNEKDLLLYLETIKDLLENSDKTGKLLQFAFNIKDKRKIDFLLSKA